MTIDGTVCYWTGSMVTIEKADAVALDTPELMIAAEKAASYYRQASHFISNQFSEVSIVTG